MIKEGFTIKCNLCGAETIATKKKSSKFREIKFNNKKIRVYGTNLEETYITCKCGNELVEG